jgi:nitrate/nitrite transporter NarK
MATGDLGQTVLPPIAGVLAAAVAWQVGIGFMIPLLLAVSVVVWLVLPAQSQSQSALNSLSMDTARRVLTELRQANMAFVALILCLYILVWQSFTGFYPTYLIEQKGFSTSLAGVLFSLFFACGVVVKPLAGSAYDRMGMRTALVLVLAGPVVGLFLLPFVDSFWLLVLLTALVSTMLGSGAVTQSFIADALSDEIQGTGLGAVRTTVATLGAGGPVAFGAIADRGYFDEGYLLLAGIMLAVVLLTLRLPQAPESTSPP